MSRDDAIEPEVARAEDGTLRLLSPTVGELRPERSVGAVLVPGERFASLHVLGRALALRVPEGVTGIILPLASERRRGRRPVGHGDLLLSLDPVIGGPQQVVAPEVTASEAEGRVFRSPLAGRFYARPAPDAQPFVCVGQDLTPGSAVGLVEVMKTFSRLVFEGPALPASAQVLELLVTDGEDIEEGTPLFRYE